jgi:hypothetical protein
LGHRFGIVPFYNFFGGLKALNNLKYTEKYSGMWWNAVWHRIAYEWVDRLKRGAALTVGIS